MIRAPIYPMNTIKAIQLGYYFLGASNRSLVTALVSYSLVWLDVLPAKRTGIPSRLQRIRNTAGRGEVCTTMEDCRHLTSQRLIDFLDKSISNAQGGGFSPC